MPTTPLLETPKEGSCFWGHKWSKWERFSVDGKKQLPNGEVHPGTWNMQRRLCLRCNYTQEELISG